MNLTAKTAAPRLASTNLLKNSFFPFSKNPNNSPQCIYFEKKLYSSHLKSKLGVTRNRDGKRQRSLNRQKTNHELCPRLHHLLPRRSKRSQHQSTRPKHQPSHRRRRSSQTQIPSRRKNQKHRHRHRPVPPPRLRGRQPRHQRQHHRHHPHALKSRKS